MGWLTKVKRSPIEALSPCVHQPKVWQIKYGIEKAIKTKVPLSVSGKVFPFQFDNNESRAIFPGVLWHLLKIPVESGCREKVYYYDD